MPVIDKRKTHAQQLEAMLFDDKREDLTIGEEVGAEIHGHLEAINEIEKNFARHDLERQLARSTLKQVKAYIDMIEQAHGATPIVMGQTLKNISGVLSDYKEQFDTLADV